MSANLQLAPEMDLISIVDGQQALPPTNGFSFFLQHIEQ